MARNRLDIHKVLELDYIDFLTAKITDEGVLAVVKKGVKKVYSHENRYKKKRDKNYDFLFVKSLDRPSYDGLWNNIKESCEHSMCELNFSARGKYLGGSLLVEKRSKLFKLFKTLFHILKFSPFLFQIKKQATWSLTITLYFHLVVLAIEMEKIAKLNFKHLVVFADMQRIDNFLVQYFKSRKTTITLQHGLYVDYTKNPNLNVVNYKNVVSDYFLAWGEETKTLIKKYHPKCEVVLCGNPTDYHQVLATRASFLTVLMDQKLFHEYNQQMLTIAFEYAKTTGVKVNIRTHPKDDINAYTINKDDVVTGVDYLQSAFAIGHTSTMIYEMMAMGMPTYKFKSDVPSNLINERLIFETAQELHEISSIRIDFIKESNYYLAYLGEESKKQYTHFFDSIEKNKRIDYA